MPPDVRDVGIIKSMPELIRWILRPKSQASYLRLTMARTKDTLPGQLASRMEDRNLHASLVWHRESLGSYLRL